MWHIYQISPGFPVTLVTLFPHVTLCIWVLFFFKFFFFLCGPFLSFYWICYNTTCVLCFGFFGYSACGILASWPGIKAAPPALKGKVLTVQDHQGRTCTFRFQIVSTSSSFPMHPCIFQNCIFPQLSPDETEEEMFHTKDLKFCVPLGMRCWESPKRDFKEMRTN